MPDTTRYPAHCTRLGRKNQYEFSAFSENSVCPTELLRWERGVVGKILEIFQVFTYSCV